jgi:hypothetical protein
MLAELETVCEHHAVQLPPQMRQLAILVFLFTVVTAARANAQGPPPRIGPFVVDAHMSIPSFPTDSQELAASRALNPAELPGRGWGGQVGAHFYLPPWGPLTLGVGGEVMLARATSTPVDPSSGLRSVEERLLSAAPQVSFNFGTGHGWSYLSGGVGRSVWSIHEVGLEPSAADVEPLQTFNYGGGARWFIKNHLAFSFDARFYEIQPGTAIPPSPGSPRTKLFIIAAGISLK